MLASEAVYVIENPDKTKDNAAVYLAGIEGVVDTYRAIRSRDTSFHAKQLDEFIHKRADGRLADAVSSAAKAKKCK